jgi:acylphosphatase
MARDTLVRACIRVSGRVQGVAYRAFAQKTASQQGLRGGVRNLHDGAVEVEVEGEKRVIETFMQSLRIGPPMARVDHLHVQWESPKGLYTTFDIWR